MNKMTPKLRFDLDGVLRAEINEAEDVLALDELSSGGFSISVIPKEPMKERFLAHFPRLSEALRDFADKLDHGVE